jgi:hypothetical protein
MLRSEVDKSIREIRTALTVSGASDLIKRTYPVLRDRGSRQSQTDGLEAFRVATQWSIEQQNLSENAVFVIEIFDADDLLDLNFWHQLTSAFQSASGAKEDRGADMELIQRAMALGRKIEFMEDTLPKLAELFKQHTGSRPEDYKQSAHLPDDTTSILKVLLPEDDHSGSSPSRIAFLMSAIEGLYEVCAAITAQGSQLEVRVVAIDSGSDKSFDFLGLARVMEELRALILGIYDRRVAIRKVKHSDLLSSIVDTLPVLQKLKDAESENLISPEESARLKKKLLTSIDQFEKSQAITAEMIDVTPEDPRQVMKDEMKFIEGPKDA